MVGGAVPASVWSARARISATNSSTAAGTSTTRLPSKSASPFGPQGVRDRRHGLFKRNSKRSKRVAGLLALLLIGFPARYFLYLGGLPLGLLDGCPQGHYLELSPGGGFRQTGEFVRAAGRHGYSLGTERRSARWVVKGGQPWLFREFIVQRSLTVSKPVSRTRTWGRTHRQALAFMRETARNAHLRRGTADYDRGEAMAQLKVLRETAPPWRGAQGPLCRSASKI
jgi:hypothetical protein